DDDEVEPAVAVEIDEAGRGAPEGAVEAGRAGDVEELAAALVEEQPEAAVLGDEDVGPAVVVDVADGHAHVMAGEVEPGAGADVLKLAAGELPEEPVGGFRLGPGVLQEEDVQAAVAVEVEQGGAGPDDLGEEVAVLGHGPRVVDEVQADLV